jgi:hypothetical protein
MDFTSAGTILTFSWLGALYGTSLEGLLEIVKSFAGIFARV